MYIQDIILLENTKLKGYIIEPSLQLKRNTNKWNNELNPVALIIPGGGYKRLEDCESDPVVFSFLNKGFSCFILNYSCGIDSKYPNPILEGLEAIKFIKINAKKYFINKDYIVCCGFSAGGHLASLISSRKIAEKFNYKYDEVKLNAIILCYPLINMERYYKNHPNKLMQFGEFVSDVELLDDINPIYNISSDYPSVFIWNTQQDDLVDCNQSIEFVTELMKKDISVEYHLFTYGVHGLSLNNSLTNKDNILNRNENAPNVSLWFDMCMNWVDKLMNFRG